jgi:hypothetical protein
MVTEWSFPGALGFRSQPSIASTKNSAGIHRLRACAEVVTLASLHRCAEFPIKAL